MQSAARFSRLRPSMQRQFSRLRCSDLFSIEPPPRQLQLHNIRLLSARPRTSLLSSLRYIPFMSQRVETSASRRHASTQSEPAPAQALQKAPSRELLLSPPALVVTRDYEWANIIIGFEQANRYTIRAAPGGEVVGFLAEESSMGGVITRNVLRTRRPFKATVFDKEGEILFTMRRPLFLVSSSVFVETPEGESLGEVHMNWHLWRRRYDLYVGKEQFATVDSGFLAVDFDMRDIDGHKLASVNKDFTGFARELFTDARQYVLRLDPSFGFQSDGVLVSDAATVNLPEEEHSDIKLGMRERAVILAAAVAIDFDYFSVHSRGHMHPGLMMMPGAGGGTPAPTPAPGAGGMGGAGAAVGADVLSDAAGDDGEGSVYNDPYEVPLDDSESSLNDESAHDNSGFEPTDGASDEQEWATFEEADHGFAEEPDNDDWDSGFGSGSGDGEESSKGLFGVLSDIFSGGDS